MNLTLNVEYSLDTKKAITKIDDILVHPLVPEHEPIPEDHIKTLIQAAIHQDTFGIVPIDNVDKFVLKIKMTLFKLLVLYNPILKRLFMSFIDANILKTINDPPRRLFHNAYVRGKWYNFGLKQIKEFLLHHCFTNVKLKYS
ncbi:hypothetical protein GOBAR_AA25597 [Gossypium barbadense]|uniref:Uncharacterized protein n=1 Tax=Gossypium barbadense TaxID=3634 RepID=A0A2P5WVF3_GOSBA|nr:hypothetical protein GOBAR_AA25597 [Gossypium barbadense]